MKDVFNSEATDKLLMILLETDIDILEKEEFIIKIKENYEFIYTNMSNEAEVFLRHIINRVIDFKKRV